MEWRIGERGNEWAAVSPSTYIEVGTFYAASVHAKGSRTPTGVRAIINNVGL